MSSVELPLVPATRSSNSSASSSRSYLHSAGSINSEKSAQSVRSQRTLQEEEPQESSGGLWDEVEHFLNKPSPSLSKLSGKTSKGASNQPKSTLPTLNGRKSSSDNQTTRLSRPARAVAAASTGSKAIDPKLLQEAFAYANRLQQINFNDDDDDGEEQQQSWRSSRTKTLMQRAALSRTNSSSSSSSLLSSDAFSSRTSGAKVSTTNVSRKKKAKSATPSAYSSSVKPKVVLKKKRNTCGDKPLSAGTESKSKVKGHMDPQTLQNLVSNFQNGTTLDELRRELVASQQSMAMSRQVLQDAAQNFFQSH
ncbi:Hypothetical protein PHPALM_17121 [Phytophthora palmivora]|uniref:Uncharacterized protein n=1 Tax=Phytophthora palmivora TaxID=4796 RepID=A0A2P4XN27_9STRA|nr:Hypothetical protein PHPALM_17121 [Phytophthora palmivora]